MRVPLSWLGDFVSWSGTATQLADRLTMAGFPVEDIAEVGRLDPRIRVGRLLAVEPHAGADRLQVCRVDVATAEPALEVTPNRGDCLSMLGIAREVAALTGSRLRRRRPGLREAGTPAAGELRVRIDAPDLCPRYDARLVRGVRSVASPLWLRLRLRRAGMRL